MQKLIKFSKFYPEAELEKKEYNMHFNSSMLCSHVKFMISKAAKPSGTVGAFWWMVQLYNA